ncbi:MAG: hypothetical protein AVDCRST_MAG74-2278 [uncultured Pyrinomonadaceae bacterium]|uniref:Uncharacterized protein n=1 Tax=uncultured Pyrinomonadaceae bacterium TaxID=2283094 RepID=A0A6J4PAY4_9BACT|nr:MAG: hypothetical protein AVDCRST_MAG74-2278 [uncultured Pyrinomonadaceae bacterium]
MKAFQRRKFMAEPNEHRRAIEPKDWAKFLEDFSSRNKNRRARFNIFFNSGETLEEGEEGHLESVALNKDGNKTLVIVKRADRTSGNEETMTDTIENVRGVTVQFDTDGSEDILEITDGKNTLFSLRFESKVDGAS